MAENLHDMKIYEEIEGVKLSICKYSPLSLFWYRSYWFIIYDEWKNEPPKNIQIERKGTPYEKKHYLSPTILIHILAFTFTHSFKSSQKDVHPLSLFTSYSTVVYKVWLIETEIPFLNHHGHFSFPVLIVLLVSNFFFFLITVFNLVCSLVLC